MLRIIKTYLFLITGFCCFTHGSSVFHLINVLKNYENSKAYCREMYTDLATIHNWADVHEMVTVVSDSADKAWIGLEIGEVWKWHWSWPTTQLDFLNWRSGEPLVNNQDACGAMDENGKWFESECNNKRSFVCQGLGDGSSHFYVDNKLSWRDARQHCLGLSSDLVSISSAEESEAVRNVSLSQIVWIGLFKDRWQWSDGSDSSFRDWIPFQPNYLRGQDCVCAVFTEEGRWNDLRCTSKRNFICQGERKPTTTTSTTTTTTTATTLSTTETTTETTTSTTPTEQTSTTTVTTATTTSTTVAATTVSSIFSTKPNTTTTANTSSSTPGTTQLSPAGNLVLIQHNMTWLDAMAYCSTHHIELVQITSREIQEKVAETAKNSTSPHVWLGLRYTCSFKFWFWTGSRSSCYQNWAAGQGPEGESGCGVTAAIEATGGQQWVALPETEALNFICSTCDSHI